MNGYKTGQILQGTAYPRKSGEARHEYDEAKPYQNMQVPIKITKIVSKTRMKVLDIQGNYETTLIRTPKGFWYDVEADSIGYRIGIKGL